VRFVTDVIKATKLCLKYCLEGSNQKYGEGALYNKCVRM
jgi:hypothetical protein